ncbi:floculation protein FLO1 [Pochonia chlamydosporia 170]|uniref:Floculation protein FLO1 n=1 Tax=Pochonia chlamydosporia 170 TaxID=1380566 RepID=A0A179EX68_METCM|nr:floculation protein FLO1 [Pochonia chlamydosporia 170]OAQ57443.1 floculation protein FLO1 [Pochonia chlamydosporia 170]
MTVIRQALMLGAAYWHAATSLVIEERTFHTSTPCLTSTHTTTIPWTGTTTTCTTVTPCSGPVTVIVETPLVAATCASTTSSRPTATPTLTPGGPCPIKAECGAAGLNIDYYANSFGGYERSKPSSYYLTEGLSPLRSSLTNVTFFPWNFGEYPPNLPQVNPNPSIGFPYWAGWTRETNGGIVVDANNFTLVYSGFYRAPATGTYQLCASADNENDIFFGQGNAFSCLDGKPISKAQPLLKAPFGHSMDIKCTNVEMIQDQFYPVRNVMGNWAAPSAFNFTIQQPGVDFANRKNAFAGEVYPLDCGLY